MPRRSRAIEAGVVYHVINRGNARLRLFHKDEDFAAFERVLAEGLGRSDVQLFTYCLMGNHWHLVARPRSDEALAQWLGWVGVTHVRRHYAHYKNESGGHLYQGRYKSFPVQEDGHFLRLCRYVEANPFRAGLVQDASRWRWSGLYARAHPGEKPFALASWPVDRPRRWSELVNEPLAEEQVHALRLSVARGRPMGDESWTMKMAKRLGLQFTLRGRGRPRAEK